MSLNCPAQRPARRALRRHLSRLRLFVSGLAPRPPRGHPVAAAAACAPRHTQAISLGGRTLESRGTAAYASPAPPPRLGPRSARADAKRRALSSRCAGPGSNWRLRLGRLGALALCRPGPGSAGCATRDARGTPGQSREAMTRILALPAREARLAMVANRAVTQDRDKKRTRRYGDAEIRRYGDAEIRRYGDTELEFKPRAVPAPPPPGSRGAGLSGEHPGRAKDTQVAYARGASRPAASSWGRRGRRSCAGFRGASRPAQTLDRPPAPSVSRRCQRHASRVAWRGPVRVAWRGPVRGPCVAACPCPPCWPLPAP